MDMTCVCNMSMGWESGGISSREMMRGESKEGEIKTYTLLG